jgi:CRP-like cAMP-binding protein
VKFTPVDNRRCNRVLASLAADDFALLQQHLRHTALRFRQCVEAADRPVDTIHFPYSGIISVVAQTNDRHHEAEVGLVGCDGMTGLPVVLGTEPPIWNGFVQVEGDGLCLAADELRELMQASGSLRSSLLRYAHAFVLQACHAALANAKGSVEQRLARWILMAHDRLPGDSLRSTHEFLALMLGVRRAGVTVALQHLQSVGVISTTRGAIEVTDRLGLERSAGGFYGAPERELECLLEVRRHAAE